jgi:hypothetical protein
MSVALVASPALAKKKRKSATTTTTTATAPTTAPAEGGEPVVNTPAYRATVEKRAAKIVAALDLGDAAKAAKVHDVLVDHYLAMNEWQATNQPEGEPLKEVLKDPQKKGSLAALHEQFNRDLAAQLTPAQVEAVKDQLTVNKVRVTYDAYVEIVPKLTDAEKGHIIELLKQAREEAIDGRSMEEKSAIFKIYKGKINTYLSADGHNVSQDYKDWGQAQKAKHGATTQPAAE